MGAAVLLTTLLAFLLIGSSSAATYTWGLKTGGNWNVASNWNGGIPGAADTVVIPADNCVGSCYITTGTTPVTVASLNTAVGSGYYLQGTLTINGDANLTDIGFANLLLTTKGKTLYNPTPNKCTMNSTTWNMMGTTTSNMAWMLYSSQVINSGSLTGTNTQPTDGLDPQAAIRSSFVNNGNATFSVDYTYWQLSFVNSGTVTFVATQAVESTLTFYGQAYQRPALDLTSSWSGKLIVSPYVTLKFYYGNHTFNSDLEWTNQPNSQISFNGGAFDAINVDVNCAVTFVILRLGNLAYVNFNGDTVINQLDFTGGKIAGSSNRIIVNNLIVSYPGCSPAAIFDSNAITIINGNLPYSQKFFISRDRTVQVNGTLTLSPGTIWQPNVYYECVCCYTDLHPSTGNGGVLQINSNATLSLNAYANDTFLANDVVYSYIFVIPVKVFGTLQMLAPMSGNPCAAYSALFAGGGTIAGTVQSNCGQNMNSFTFAGNWAFNQGTNFVGASPFAFNVTSDINSTSLYGTFTFNVPVTIPSASLYGSQAILQLNSDMHIKKLTWSGGMVLGKTNSTTLYLDAGTHRAQPNSGSAIHTGRVINDGTFDAHGASIKSFNGGMLINNNALIVGDDSFNGGAVLNMNKMSGNGMSKAFFYNSGTFSSNTPGSSVAFLQQSDVILGANSSVTLAVYDEPTSPNFDKLLLGGSTCKLGGELVVNVSFPSSKTPQAGYKFDIVQMIVSPTNSALGGCLCQFDKLTVIGLTGGLTGGLIYDVSPGQGAQTRNIQMVVCAAGDTACASNTRGGSPPCSTPVFTTAFGSSTGIPTTTTATTTVTTTTATTAGATGTGSTTSKASSTSTGSTSSKVSSTGGAQATTGGATTGGATTGGAATGSTTGTTKPTSSAQMLSASVLAILMLVASLC